MATCDREALLEKLYDQMERELQVGSSSIYSKFIVSPPLKVLKRITDTDNSLNQACVLWFLPFTFVLIKFYVCWAQTESLF